MNNKSSATDESAQLKHYRAVCAAGERYATSCNGKLGELSMYYVREISKAEQALSPDDRDTLSKEAWLDVLRQLGQGSRVTEEQGGTTDTAARG